MSIPKIKDFIDGNESIVFYDGTCGFCNKSVLFIAKNDRKGRYWFAPLQSELASQLLTPFQIDCSNLDSIVCFEAGKPTKKFSAAQKITRHLNWPWPILGLFMCLIPPFFGDFFYNLIAKNRYLIAGKTQCELPTSDLRKRFLAD
jgi:predicted DCC family thiol-disulfide oxidoreductase YuxK